MSEKTDRFISVIGTLARNEYLSREKWILPSVCIAQASLESGWNLEAKTLFGIKGKGFTATTTEYYNGNKFTIQDSFKKYPSVASAVVGYYDFLSSTPRYSKSLNNTDYANTVYHLIHTNDGKPYATDPSYIDKIISIIEKYNLTTWDSPCYEVKKPIDEIAIEVLQGKWGVGNDRATRLFNSGYDYLTVQKRVNELDSFFKWLDKQKNKKSDEEIAREVIKGKWGVMPERKTRIEAEGYNYDAVRKIVNRLMKG